MKDNLTDITVVIDRSGSMESCRTDAEGGLNAFIRSQAAEEGEALLTLVQFDDRYEFVHKAVPIKKVPKFTLVPRGSTALFDAVGRAINETGKRLASMAEEDRPNLVIVAIVTDGEENSSTEFTGAHIKAMIDLQTSKYNWQFTYLGANQDAFSAAEAIGIAASSALNYDVASSASAFDSLSSNTKRMRDASVMCSPIRSFYTDEERSSSMGEDEA
ncbi:MAG TPA: vWA domain-containing protein [Capsulimonadaceae bacterium]